MTIGPNSSLTESLSHKITNSMTPHISRFRISFLLALLPLLLFCGCAAKKFRIEFRLPSGMDTTVRLLYHASDKLTGVTLDPICAIAGGKGVVECPAVLPALVYVLSPSGQPVIAFYAERGDKIVISSEDADPLTWRIEGNKLSEEWTAWRLDNLTALRSGSARRINEAVNAFVSKNPESKLSTLLLLTAYDRRTDPKGYESLWRKLKGKALEPELISLAARADQTDAALPATGQLKRFVVRSSSGSDTISPGTPSLLFFWHSGENKRHDGIETLRRLQQDFSDTTKRLLVDICLDSDSTSWYMPMAADSLRHTIRGWMPAGEADQAAMQLGVSRSPFFIVTDRKGKVTYRGDLPAEAEAEFRKIMK